MRAGGCETSVSFRGEYFFQCFGPDGQTKWEVREKNLVVNAGLNHILDVVFAGSAQTNPWYLGLVASSMTVASADTMSVHAGWAEVVPYATATRAVFVDVRTNRLVSNSASTVSHAINTAATIGGALLVSTNNKGGSSGILLCAVAFTGGDKAVADLDTLTITYTFSAADS
jgi:hypothetical protein